MSKTNTGMKWYNDGSINKMFNSDDPIPENFKPGRLPTSRKDTKGRKAYTDGNVVKFFMIGDPIPEGFYEGIPEEKKEHLFSIRMGGKGKKRSETQKAKISAKAKERLANPENHPMFGKHHSEKTRNLLSDQRKGKPSAIKGLKLDPSVIEAIDLKHIEEYGSLENYYIHRSDKAKKTKINRYGNPNYTNQEKRLETISKNPDFYVDREIKRQKTLLDKYGSSKDYQRHKIDVIMARENISDIDQYYKQWRLTLYKSSKKDNKLEKRCKEFLVNNKFNFQQHYLITCDQYSHEFDFAIFDCNNNLEILIDCDGRYYHGYESDINGKSVNNYSDDYRSLLVPEGVKFEIILEGKDSEKSSYQRLLQLKDMNYDEYLEDIFNWCRSIGFPYPVYADKKLLKSYDSLCKSDINKFSNKARYGEMLIKHFHPSIYHANKRNKLSPFNAWNNDILLKECISNRIIYKGCDLDPSKILSGFSVTQIAPKVSIFNPYLAKYIISKYLNSFETIFDPFSGYSGRLLGAVSLNKHYIGQDINPTTVNESINLINYLDLLHLVNITCVDSSEVTGCYDCLFTCSPYGDKESWNQDIVNRSCDDWIDICLKNYQCSRYIFVVDQTEKYKHFIVEEISNKNHFSDNKEYIICIDANIDNLA